MPQIAVSVDEDGMVTLGGLSKTGGLGLQTLEVLGGALQFDIARPTAGVRALLSNVEVASWWLPEVFGEPAAIEAIRMAGLDANAPRPSELIDSDWGPLLPTVTRLMSGLWIKRWWPAPLAEHAIGDRKGMAVPYIEEWLIDVELAALASDAEQLFGGLDVASELAAPHLVKLASSLAQFQGSDVPVERWIGGMLEESAIAALDAVPLDTPGFDELEAATDHKGHAEKPEVIPLPSRFRSDLALAAGAPAVVGRSTAYWLDVHPRRASASPGAVRWEIIETDSGYRVDASVNISGASPGHDGDFLYGRVETSRGTLGIAFLQDDERPLFVSGSTLLDSTTDPASVRVTLYSSSLGLPSRQSPSDVQIAETRAEVLEGTRRFIDASATLIASGNFDGRQRVPAAALHAVNQASRQS